MSIKDKIVNAVGSAIYKPNVLYLGMEEGIELRCETGATNNVTRFMGMKVVEVRQDSWLQVAYVEGVA